MIQEQLQSQSIFTNDLFDQSEDWKQIQQENAKFKNPKLKDLFPLNYVAQRQEFFKYKKNYNPHFCYKTIVAPQIIPLNTEYQELANKILINNKYDGKKLPLLNEKQVMQIIFNYLQNLGLSQYVEIKLQSDCLSRTSISFYKQKAVLKLRTPLEYTKISLEGVLNHEIGTHLVRRLNHKENCIRKPTQKGKLIQQGLAVINQLIPQNSPFLFKAAIRYLAAIYASKMSFKQVYKNLNKWIQNQEDCWRQVVRVKRGMANTDIIGGYYKDQSYFIGAVQILKNRKQINFKKVFYGKLHYSQCENLTNGVLPSFVQNEQKMKIYLKKLDAISICNFIE